MDWDGAYADGSYRTRWHCEEASGELVATLAAIGLPTRGRAVDLGCGAGTEALYLSDVGADVVGVDLSEEALRIARRRAAERGLKVQWELASVVSLPVADRSVVFANDRGCLQHLSKESRAAYADELARVTVPGANLLLRACRACDDGSIEPVTVDELDTLFQPPRWERGFVLPLALRHDGGVMPSWVTVIRRRSVRW